MMMKQNKKQKNCVGCSRTWIDDGTTAADAAFFVGKLPKIKGGSRRMGWGRGGGGGGETSRS